MAIANVRTFPSPETEYEEPLSTDWGRIVVIRKGTFTRIAFEVVLGYDATGNARYVRANEHEANGLCRVYVKRQLCGDGDYL